MRISKLVCVLHPPYMYDVTAEIQNLDTRMESIQLSKATAGVAELVNQCRS